MKTNSNFLTLFLMFCLITNSIEAQLIFEKTYYEFDLPNITEMLTADYDNDGDLDFVLTAPFPNDLFFIEYVSQSNVVVSTISEDLRLELMANLDFDQDGDVDIIGSSPFEDTAYVLLNDGNGNFTPQELSLLDYDSILVGDFDKDGQEEMAVGVSNNLRIYSFTDGNLNIKNIVSSDITFGEPNSIDALDYNGDGITDFAAIFTFRGVYVFLQDALGYFERIEISDTGTNAKRVKSALINDDDLYDFLIYDSFSGSTKFVISNSSGTYDNAKIDSELGRNIFSTFADIDQDGDIDILYVEEEGNSLYLNQDGLFEKTTYSTEHEDGEAGGIADIDQDGDLDFFIFSSEFFDPGLVIYNNDTPPSSTINELPASIKIYPSPTTDFLNIETKGALQYDVLNLSGQRLFSGEMINKKTLDISMLSKGAYILRITEAEKMYFSKIIKL